MKKFSKITVLVLVFCLCFTTAAFGAGVGPTTDAPSDEGQKLYTCKNLPFAPGHEFQLVTLDDVAWRSGEYSGTPTMEKIPARYPHFDTPTETPLLVLVLEFNNISYKDDYDWGNSIFQGQYSLAQYYKDMSFNQFAFVPAKETSAYNVDGNHNTKDKVNDGVVHITLTSNHGIWDLDSGDAEDKKMIAAFVEGVKKADAYVDFSSFDKNHDGEITTDEMALAVVVAGYEAAADSSLSQGSNYYLWSHAWGMYSGWYYYYQSQYPDPEDFMPMPDGVMVDSYIAIAEQLQKNRQEPISVLAHELGHYLGLPDLYNTSYGSGTWSTYDVSDLSVMCSGSWGWNNIINDYMPVAFDAWSRCCLGWVNPQTVSNGVHDVVSDKGSEYNVLRVETGVSGEYYLLENREISGWDQGLYDLYHTNAPNGGLVCWHIDDAVYDTYADSNTVNNPGHRPAVMPLYPEKSNNKITFIGTLSSDGLRRPFFTYAIWNSYYAGTLDCVNFPRYNGSDSYSGRTFSGVEMKILQAPNSHTVRVDFGACPHDLTAIPAKAATCTEAGNTAYWKCSLCGKYFSDAAGNNEIDENSWVIPALGHDWDTENVVFNWTQVGSGFRAEAVFTCKTDPTHTTTIPATVTYVSGDGTTTFTATAVFEGNTYTDQKTVESVPEPEHLRIMGANRYETALMAADHMKEIMSIDKFDTVIVAYGGNFADALSGSYLANVKEAPILLVYSGFEQTLFDYIRENTVDGAKIYILGGNKAVSENFEGLLTGYDVERLGGANRFDTNVLILEEANETEGAPKNEVLVCSGMNFADALSTSSVGLPILLVGDNISDKQKQYLTDVNADEAWIIGGVKAVNESVEGELATFVPAANIGRLGGANRYETSYMVADEFFAGGAMTAVLVYGMNFPDGLSGGAVASVIGSPVLLAMNNDTMNAFVAKWVTESGAISSITFGGPGLISDDSIRAIMNQPDAVIEMFE